MLSVCRWKDHYHVCHCKSHPIIKLSTEMRHQDTEMRIPFVMKAQRLETKLQNFVQGFTLMLRAGLQASIVWLLITLFLVCNYTFSLTAENAVWHIMSEPHHPPAAVSPSSCSSLGGSLRHHSPRFSPPHTSIIMSYFPNCSKYSLSMTKRPPAIIGVLRREEGKHKMRTGQRNEVSCRQNPDVWGKLLPYLMGAIGFPCLARLWSTVM